MGNWNFDKLDGIHDAYNQAFRTKVKEFSEVFKDQQLRWLAETRHILVHNGGRSDRQFWERTRRHPTFKTIPEDSQVQIGISTCRDLACAAIQQGEKLINLVNELVK